MAGRTGRFRVFVAAVVASATVVLGVAGSIGHTAPAAYSIPRSPATPKLDSRLADISRVAEAQGRAAAVVAARLDGVASRGQLVRVIVASHAGGAAAAEAAVRTAGGVVEGTAGALTEALVPPDAVSALAKNAAVADVRQPYPFKAQAVDEAVHLTDADAWHTAGNTGSGVKIAVIDLGFYGYSSLLGSALPASVTAIDHCSGNITASPASGGTEHGTAVAELVHQMAPGAQLYLICVDSEVGLAQAEQDVINDGIKIVNHSVAWFNTSRGDGSGAPGTPDAIVADARAHGVLWVNAAGNYGEDHWSGSIAPGDVLATFTDSGHNDQFNRVTIQSGEQACAFLKWDAWPTTTEDYDLALVRMSDQTVVAASTNDQAAGPAAPTEALCYTNTGTAQTFGIVIAAYSAAGAERLDLYYDGSSPLAAENDGSVTEPASSPAALAVGAECWAKNRGEIFSSRGPTIDGRTKPDMAGQDGVSTETYGPAAADCRSGFLGTSAAAPQVAGAAALVIQHEPTLAVAGVVDALRSSAAQIPDDGFDPGPPTDNFHGSGDLSLPPLANTPRLAVAVNNYFAPDGFFSASGLVTMNGDGSGARFVSESTGHNAAFGPTWSPDGRRLQYMGDGGSFVSNADGTNVQAVGYEPDAEWSPIEDKIVYRIQANVFLTTPGLVDGSGSQLTSDSTFGVNLSPAWSPDASKVVWAHAGQLWVMKADGSAKTVLYDPGAGNSVFYPDWSPDGARIAFVVSSGSGLELAVINANGTGVHDVVPLSISAYASSDGSDAYPRPRWLSDSSTIGYADSNAQIVTVSAAGGTPTPLGIAPFAPDVTAGTYVGGVDWQPAAALLTAPENTELDPLEGSLRVGGWVSERWTGWTGATPMTFAFQWQRCNSSGASCVNIAGATNASYRSTVSDAGSKLKLVVTATNPNGSGSASVVSSDVVGAATPYPTSMPVLSGSATVGSTLSVSGGVWQNAPASAVYEWLRCDPSGGCSPIAGASDSTYVVANADVGSTIRGSIGEPYGASTVWNTSDQSATVPSGGDGGGGGGGGGGSAAPPNMAVQWTSVSNVSPPAGSEVDFTVTVSNHGAGSGNHAHLSFTLPATMKLNGAPYSERGSGCVGTTTVDCNFDYLMSGGSTIVRFGVIVSGAGAQSITATASADNESDPSDNSATVTLQVSATTSGTPPPAPPPPRTVHKGKTVNGTAGANRLVGTAYADVLNGRAGNDVLLGVGGNDTLNGGTGKDRLAGGTGNDSLLPGPGADTVFGGAGNDVVRAHDRVKDVIDCGTGRDTVYADRIDKVAKDCERVLRS